MDFDDTDNLSEPEEYSFEVAPPRPVYSDPSIVVEFEGLKISYRPDTDELPSSTYEEDEKE